jgi:hypothetical protein
MRALFLQHRVGDADQELKPGSESRQGRVTIPAAPGAASPFHQQLSWQARSLDSFCICVSWSACRCCFMATVWDTCFPWCPTAGQREHKWLVIPLPTLLFACQTKTKRRTSPLSDAQESRLLAKENQAGTVPRGMVAGAPGGVNSVLRDIERDDGCHSKTQGVAADEGAAT